MGVLLHLDDPDDPGTSVEAYVRLVVNNRVRPGLGLGLHAEFLAYRTQAAANKPGARPLANIAMDIPADRYAELWPTKFSAEALQSAGIDPDAVVYAYALRYDPVFTTAVPVLEPGQIAYMFFDEVG
jgi:hypothetical protein